MKTSWVFRLLPHMFRKIETLLLQFLVYTLNLCGLYTKFVVSMLVLVINPGCLIIFAIILTSQHLFSIKFIDIAKKETLNLFVIVIVIVLFSVEKWCDTSLTQAIFLIIQLHVLRISKWKLEK